MMDKFNIFLDQISNQDFSSVPVPKRIAKDMIILLEWLYENDPGVFEQIGFHPGQWSHIGNLRYVLEHNRNPFDKDAGDR